MNKIDHIYSKEILKTHIAFHEILFQNFAKNDLYDFFSLVDAYMQSSNIRAIADNGCLVPVDDIDMTSILQTIDYGMLQKKHFSSKVPFMLPFWMADIYCLLQWNQAISSTILNKIVPARILAEIYTANKGRSLQSICEDIGSRYQLSSHSLNFINIQDLTERCPMTNKNNITTMYFKNPRGIGTVIHADFKNQTISIENKTDRILDRAFGVNEHPTWSDFEFFLEDRCFPSTRDKLKLVLRDVGVDYYDPMAIITKTQGRMHEDHAWIELEGEEYECDDKDDR